MHTTDSRALLRLGIAALAAVAIVASGLPANAAQTQRLAAAPGDPVSVSVSAPSVVKRNATAKVTVTTDPGHTGTAQLLTRSTTTNNWIGLATITITDGAGTLDLPVTTSRSYKVEADVGGTSKVFGIAMEDSYRRAVTSAFTGTTVVSGELAFIRGTAYRSGSTWKGVKVTIQRALIGGASWSTVGTATTSSTSGQYTFRTNPSSSYVYRATISGTTAKSGPTAVASYGSDRTLEGRASMLTAITGSPKSSITNVPSSALPSGVTAARYRHYTNGSLYEVTRESGIRTWYVYDRINSKYAGLSRWNGKLGLPMRDAKCGLLEGGCVQRFTGGAVYQNSTKAGAFVAYAAVAESEMLAVAVSQAGYIEPTWRKNKYNAWIGSSNAWCSVFISWTAAASGNSSWAPRRGTYDGYVSDLKNSGVLNYSGTPPIGSSVLFDWGSGTPSHSGMVRGKSGSYLYTVEGNTSDGKGGDERGVYLRSRHIDGVWAWYWPHEYGAS